MPSSSRQFLYGLVSRLETRFRCAASLRLIHSDVETLPACQLSLAIARLFSGPQRDLSFHISDQQALCSLLTFNVGAFIGRIGDRMGPHSRAWLSLGTFIQALFTMAAAIATWKSDSPLSVATDRFNPAWTNALTFVSIGFMSASIGLQGIMGKRINTQFTTTGSFRSSLYG